MREFDRAEAEMAATKINNAEDEVRNWPMPASPQNMADGGVSGYFHLWAWPAAFLGRDGIACRSKPARFDGPDDPILDVIGGRLEVAMGLEVKPPARPRAEIPG